MFAFQAGSSQNIFGLIFQALNICGTSSTVESGSMSSILGTSVQCIRKESINYQL
jgi:hypothetical protein